MSHSNKKLTLSYFLFFLINRNMKGQTEKIAVVVATVTDDRRYVFPYLCYLLWSHLFSSAFSTMDHLVKPGDDD